MFYPWSRFYNRYNRAIAFPLYMDPRGSIKMTTPERGVVELLPLCFAYVKITSTSWWCKSPSQWLRSSRWNTTCCVPFSFPTRQASRLAIVCFLRKISKPRGLVDIRGHTLGTSARKDCPARDCQRPFMQYIEGLPQLGGSYVVWTWTAKTLKANGCSLGKLKGLEHAFTTSPAFWHMHSGCWHAQFSTSVLQIDCRPSSIESPCSLQYSYTCKQKSDEKKDKYY